MNVLHDTMIWTTAVMDALAIVGECGDASLPGVYALGSFSRGVSFLTQQMRALNLVWALSESSAVGPGQTVAVVGGGLAGLTAAAALVNRGLRTVLCEARLQYMPVQNRSTLRYIHPYAHLWPDSSALKSKTELPFLNWKADTANNVRKAIIDQFDLIEPSLLTRKGYTVAHISAEGSRPVITYRSPRFEREKEEVHAVIMAVGFGREPGKSYWEPDGLEYLRYAPGRKVVVISGCGDGGIIDVLRLRLEDFTHETAVNALLGSSYSSTLAAQVTEIEAKSKTILDQKLRGAYLDASYRDIARRLPSDLKSSILSGLRADTKVHLISPFAVPFAAPSMPVNRMLLAILLTSDTDAGFEYHEGRTPEDKIEYEGGLPIVNLTHNPFPQDPIACEQVLLRHGPKPVIDPTLPAMFVNNLREKHGHFLTPTDMALRPFWPNNFYRTVGSSGTPPSELPIASPASSFGSDIPPEKILYCGSPLHKGEMTGTLGCFVRLATGEVGFLSTAHFLAENQLLGERVFASVKPYRRDVGSLYSFIGLKKTRSARNLVDAAVGILSPDVAYQPRFADYWKLPDLCSPRDAQLGEKVFKVGAGSGLTWGVVMDTQMVSKVGDNGIFVDVLRIESKVHQPFMAAGDSGAMIVGEDGAPLGLIFAGDPDGKYALACSVIVSCSLLGCRVLTSQKS